MLYVGTVKKQHINKPKKTKMNPDTPAPSTPAPAAKAKPARGPFNQEYADELELSQQLCAVAAKPEYSGQLADEDITPAFVNALGDKIVNANAKLGGATGGKTKKKVTTKREEALKKTLLAKIAAIQKRAKRKYPAEADPARADYFIGVDLGDNRPLLEASTRALILTLDNSNLPGQKPTHAAELQTALDDYVQVQTDQTSDQADASGELGGLEAFIKGIAADRRQIQYAADTIWPASDPANAPIRREFKIPANRAMK
jgi:hypothetical protein